MKLPEIPPPNPDAPHEISRTEKAFRESSNFPLRHLEAVVRPDKDWANNHAEVVAALTKAGAIVCVCGPRGTGKTQAATEIARDYHARYEFPLYRTALEFFYLLRATFGTDKAESVVMAQHTSPALLVIDEVQVRGETTFEGDRLTYLVDARYRSNKRTILISNLPTRDIAKGGPCIEDNLGASIVSRIQETGRVIQFAGKSFRVNRQTNEGNEDAKA